MKNKCTFPNRVRPAKTLFDGFHSLYFRGDKTAEVWSWPLTTTHCRRFESLKVWVLRSSGLLHSVYWQFRTDVPKQPIGPI